jgi:hypothetical protein
MDTSIEPEAIANKRIDISAESRHGFEEQNRYILLGHAQRSAEAAGTAADHDGVEIRQVVTGFRWVKE